ncbi:MAG TPA: ATP-binding cassette domain-containing protein, partial [Rhodospirillales bacterium]|nr:ATP-binding cassette domain-containing protein [Rhodospirillales bacterium]
MNGAIRLEAVEKRFHVATRQVTALRDFSVRIERGTFVGLVGPDGAGKTTLMRLLAGLLLPDEGTVEV